jgi:hypothetical protein
VSQQQQQQQQPPARQPRYGSGCSSVQCGGAVVVAALAVPATAFRAS